MRRREVCRAGCWRTAALAALLMTACGPPAADPRPGPTGRPEPTASDEAAASPRPSDPPGALEVVVGVFGGDGQLEGGCAWIDAAGTRYELQLPEGYTVRFAPVEMIGRDGDVVARDGDRLHLLGRPVEGVATICQIGPLFKVSEVHPL